MRGSAAMMIIGLAVADLPIMLTLTRSLNLSSKPT
jgi:hypothetical protein